MTETANRLERRRPTSVSALKRRAEWIRLETIRLIDIAGSGHYSSTFSSAEIFAVLYYHALRLDPFHPDWPGRDRFVMGKGHAAVGLYPCLADLGFFPTEWLDSYTRLGSPLGDHPDMRKIPGVDFSSGSIGHNLSVAVGMALAGHVESADYRVVALLGDGELHEGQVYEAFMAAAHFRLGNLVAIIDANGACLDGKADAIMRIEPIPERIAAFGWRVHEVDGHDVAEWIRIFESMPDPSSETPTAIIARTVKGKGVSFMEQAEAWHLGFLGAQDRERAEAEITTRMQ